jgi:hypothetical protein
MMTREEVISYVVPNQNQTHNNAVSTTRIPATTVAAPPPGPSVTISKMPKPTTTNMNNMNAQAVPKSFLAGYLMGGPSQ